VIRYDPADPGSFVFDTGSAAGVTTALGADPAALEQAVRQALSAKGVTGALQAEAVRKTLAAAASGESVVDLREYTRPDEQAESPDKVEQIERLARLRDSGAITEGEFTAAKTKLLSEL
jgi:2-methylcitrate dehydratase PrpD